jgi:ssDNA-binding Zn-finger/Zn-ribbon topoisomerase 1
MKQKQHLGRHIDVGTPLGVFASEAFVVCHKCASAARVTCKSKYWTPYAPRESKLVCLNCPFQTTGDEAAWLGPGVGVAKERCPNCGFKWLEARLHRRGLKGQGRRWAAVSCPECQKTARVPVRWQVRRLGSAVDPVFGLPLWLQLSCCGETLWAYNASHLWALRGYVSAGLRERVGVMQWSMFSRLPKWMSAHKNRERILTSMKRLEERLPEPAA